MYSFSTDNILEQNKLLTDKLTRSQEDNHRLLADINISNKRIKELEKHIDEQLQHSTSSIQQLQQQNKALKEEINQLIQIIILNEPKTRLLLPKIVRQRIEQECQYST